MEKDVNYYAKAIHNQFCYFKFCRRSKSAADHRVAIQSGKYNLVFGKGSTPLEAIRDAYVNLLEYKKKQMTKEAWEELCARKIICRDGSVIETLPP